MAYLIWIAMVLAVAWVISFVVLHVAGFLIHLLIIAAIILFIVSLFDKWKA